MITLNPILGNFHGIIVLRNLCSCAILSCSTFIHILSQTENNKALSNLVFLGQLRGIIFSKLIFCYI